MTSSISFRKLLREDIKKRIWLLGISVGIFLIVLPVATVMKIDNALYWSATDPDFVKQWFMEVELGSNWVGALVILGAMLGAVTASLYLHSRRQIDFYHSLPVKKEQWFVVAYISSFLQVMVPCLLSYILRYLIGYVKGVTSKESFEMLGAVMGISLISYHIVYIISVIGMIVTGKMLTGILMIAFLHLYYPFVLALKSMLFGTVFETYLPIDGMGGYDSFLYCMESHVAKHSPVFIYFHMIDKYMKHESLFRTTVVVILTGAVLFVIALLLYKKRPTAAAGKAIAFPILEPIVKVMVAITVGLFFSTTVLSQYDATNKVVPIWVTFIGVIAAMLACCAIEFLYSLDLKMMWKRKKSFAIAILGTLGICVALQFDVFGYDTYLPKQNEIVAMSVGLINGNTEVFENSLAHANEDVRMRLNRLRTTDFSRIYKVAQNGVRHVGEKIDPWENTKYIPVEIAYYLKNGEAVYREYYVDYEEIYRCMDALFASREYRENYFDLSLLGEGNYEFEFVNMYFGSHQKLSLSKEQSEQLLGVYKEEMETKPFSVFENAHLVAQLHFVKGDSFIDFPIYEEFTKTLEFLDTELKALKSLTVKDISAMTVEYTVGSGENSRRLQKSIRQEEMQQVLDSLCYVQNGFIGMIAEDEIYVTIETTMGQSYTYFIRKGQIPENLIR